MTPPRHPEMAPLTWTRWWGGCWRQHKRRHPPSIAAQILFIHPSRLVVGWSPRLPSFGSMLSWTLSWSSLTSKNPKTLSTWQASTSKPPLWEALACHVTWFPCTIKKERKKVICNWLSQLQWINWALSVLLERLEYALNHHNFLNSFLSFFCSSFLVLK